MFDRRSGTPPSFWWGSNGGRSGGPEGRISRYKYIVKNITVLHRGIRPQPWRRVEDSAGSVTARRANARNTPTTDDWSYGQREGGEIERVG